LARHAVDPEETDTIRRHVQRHTSTTPFPFRLTIERQPGRKLASKQIGRPKKTATATDDLLESRL